MSSVGIIGLGLMGTAFSNHLLREGYEVVGYDPDPDRSAEHTARGGVVVNSPKAVAERVPVVIISVLTNAIGRVVCFAEDGIAASGNKGLLVLDTTTGLPEAAIEFAAGLSEHGIRFMGCTVSGNSIQAEAGDLATILGGAEEDVADASEVMQHCSRSIHHVGPVGAAAKAKLVVNMILGINRTALAEGLVLGEKAGLELEPLFALLRDSAAYSKAMDIWGDRMLNDDFVPPGSRARQSHKDAKVITGFARDVGSPAMLANVVRQLLQFAEMSGLGEIDNAGAIEVQRRLGGIGRIPQ